MIQCGSKNKACFLYLALAVVISIAPRQAVAQAEPLAQSSSTMTKFGLSVTNLANGSKFSQQDEFNYLYGKFGPRIGGLAGIVYSRALAGDLTVQLEGLLELKGGSRSYSINFFGGFADIEESVSLVYLSTPLLIKTSFPANRFKLAHAYLGGSAGLNLIDHRSGSYLIDDGVIVESGDFSGSIGNTQKIDLSFVFGVEFGLGSGPEQKYLDFRIESGKRELFKSAKFGDLGDDLPVSEIGSTVPESLRNISLTISIVTNWL